MPPAPASEPTPPVVPPTNKNWDSLRNRANTVGSIVALFIFLLAVGGAVGYFVSQSKKNVPAAKAPTVETLSAAELAKLGEIGANLGATGQVLNIGADALFRGKANVTGDLTVGGHLNANGPVTLSQLNITGTTAATGLNVGSNLNVTGITSLQKALTVNDLTTINSNLTVSGNISAGGIIAKSLTISGPLVITHLVTGGATPFFAAGAVGSGGTVSLSGNDTTGSLNINTGTGPTAYTTLISVTFRTPFTGQVHVLLTPKTSGAAASQYFVISTSTGFRVLCDTPPSGQPLSFDYFVTQ